MYVEAPDHAARIVPTRNAGVVPTGVVPAAPWRRALKSDQSERTQGENRENLVRTHDQMSFLDGLSRNVLVC